MGHEVLKKFDQYFLLDCVAQGGMAEIFRARIAAPDGAGRIVVVKRILATFGKNEEFKRMFRDEFEVMKRFNHTNIIYFHNFGEFKNQPFIEMEYCDGKNLRQFLTRLQEQQKRFPIDAAVWIIEQTAAGLHYAHTFKDKLTGEPLNLVHRDVSPQNILISYDAGIKVIDFGIAKAKTNSESTRVGVIKGKPSYLSPEQITGAVLDGRSDVFALGAVLWEVLTGRKLFQAKKGENEFAVLKLIESSDTHVKPPSSVNPEVPKALDDIVLRALTKDREKRYQNAEELQRALRQFLAQNFPKFSPSDLGQLAKNLFKVEIVEDRKNLQKLYEKAETLLKEDFTIVSPGPARPAPKTFDTKEIDATGIQIERNTPAQSFKKDMPAHFKNQSQSISRSTSRSQVSMSVKKQSSSRLGWLVLAAGAVGVVLYGSQLMTWFKGTTESSPEKVTEKFDDRVAAQGQDDILLKLELHPGFSGMSIQVVGAGGKSANVNPNDPQLRVPLDAGLELVVSHRNFKTFRREFVLDSKDLRGLPEYVMAVQLEPHSFGVVSIYSTPSAEASIWPTDDGSRQVASTEKPWVIKTPFQNERIPVGQYVVRLENKLLGMEKEVLLKVEDGKVTTINERLEIKKN